MALLFLLVLAIVLLYKNGSISFTGVVAALIVIWILFWF